MQYCRNSSASALELLQSCTKPSTRNAYLGLGDNVDARWCPDDMWCTAETDRAIYGTVRNTMVRNVAWIKKEIWIAVPEKVMS